MNQKQPFILCATDFSPRAVAAATVAAQLALRRSQKLRLVHVSTASSPRTLAAAARYLEGELQRLKRTGADVESALLKGPRPSEVLLNHIRAQPPTLLVLASSIKGPIDRWSMGSFSERIAEASPAPTLVVRNPAVFDSWDWTRDRLKLLLALDLFASSDVVVRWAKDFQMSGPCDFVSCHVNRIVPTVEEAAMPSARPVNPPALQSRLERELRKKIRDQTGDDCCPIVVRAHFGEPGPCIVDIAREVKAHVIAVGTHQRHGFGRLAQFSVSRELLHESDLNVVCVPVTATLDPREAHIPEFHRVLVATDFSEMGNAAVPFACGACCIGGLVKIVHVMPPQGRSLRKPAGRPSAAEIVERLQSLIPVETGARCRPPEVEALENRDVAQAVCAEAERFGADLVCLSSHGLGGSRALHGSVTKAVLKKIRRPLLVIRRPEE